MKFQSVFFSAVYVQYCVRYICVFLADDVGSSYNKKLFCKYFVVSLVCMLAVTDSRAWVTTLMGYITVKVRAKRSSFQVIIFQITN